MLGRIGVPELIIIFFVILLLFGAKALPEIAKSLAKAIKAFKHEARDIQDGFNDSAEDEKKETVKVERTSDDFNPNSERRDWRPKPEDDSKSKKA